MHSRSISCLHDMLRRGALVEWVNVSMYSIRCAEDNLSVYVDLIKLHGKTLEVFQYSITLHLPSDNYWLSACLPSARSSAYNYYEGLKNTEFGLKMALLSVFATSTSWHSVGSPLCDVWKNTVCEHFVVNLGNSKFKLLYLVCTVP